MPIFKGVLVLPLPLLPAAGGAVLFSALSSPALTNSVLASSSVLSRPKVITPYIAVDGSPVCVKPLRRSEIPLYRMRLPLLTAVRHEEIESHATSPVVTPVSCLEMLGGSTDLPASAARAATTTASYDSAE